MTWLFDLFLARNVHRETCRPTRATDEVERGAACLDYVCPHPNLRFPPTRMSYIHPYTPSPPSLLRPPLPPGSQPAGRL
eukprot:344714-Chlamydomonas_euryale.AAC.6